MGQKTNKKKNKPSQRLIQETIAIMSADMFDFIYKHDDINGGDTLATAQRIIELAVDFENKLDWENNDEETEDYLLALEQYEEEEKKRIQTENEEKDEE